MGRRLLVTGYGGFVAGSVVLQAGSEWSVIAVSRSMVATSRPDIRHVQLDLRDRVELKRLLDETRPDVVIHTAAMANIDRCELEPDAATQINVDVTRHIAECCAQNGTKIVFCSTDAIFDGVKGMYQEEDVPCPLNHYAETKVEAEGIVSALPDAVIARLALVMGLPLIGAGNSFMANMRTSFEQGIPVTMPANEIRTPVDVVTLGRALLELASGTYCGVMHLAGNTRLNRHAMGVHIAQRLGYSADWVESTDSNAIAGRARRPNDASLNNARAQSMLTTPMLSFGDGLDLAFKMSELHAT